MNVRLPASDSEPEDARGLLPAIAAGEIPILNAEALVMRGCTDPTAFVAGTGRARNSILPFEVPFWTGVPPLECFDDPAFEVRTEFA